MFSFPAILWLIIFHFLIKPAFSFPAYDCSNKNIVYDTISLSEIKDCQVPTENITINNVEIQVIQERKYKEIEINQCLVTVSHFIFRCGKTFDQFSKHSINDEIIEISREDCKTLLRTNSYVYRSTNQNHKFSKLKRNFLNSIPFTSHGSVSGTGECIPGIPLTINGVSYDRPVISSIIKIIYKYEKATKSLKDGKIVLPLGIECNFGDLSCFDINNGMTYWEALTENFGCNTNEEYDILYQGYADEIISKNGGTNKVYYQFSLNGHSFQVLSINEKVSCNLKFILTEHPKLMIVKRFSNYPFKFNYNPQIYEKNINLQLFYDVKLAIAMTKTKTSVEQLFHEMMSLRCNFRRESMFRFLTLARLSPTEFSYDFFQKPGFSAVVSGEVAYIIKCQIVEVSFREEDNCYNHIPVYQNNRSRYVNPRTKILSDVGEIVPCSNLMAPMFYLDGGWYKLLSRQLISAVKPKIIDPYDSVEWKFPEVNEIINSGIYSEDQMNKLQDIIMRPVESKAISTRFQSALKGDSVLPTGYSIENTIETEKFLEKTGKKLVEKMSDLTLGLSYWGGLLSGVFFFLGVLSLIIKIINTFLNVKKLHAIVGCSAVLFCSIFDAVVSWIMYDRTLNTRTNESKDVEEGIALGPIINQPSAPPKQTGMISLRDVFPNGE